jgi:hypothetical protein
VLSPDQQKLLASLEKEMVQVGLERTQYTFDHTKNGIAQWDRLWARKVEIEKQIEKLKGADHVSMAAELVQSQA